MKDFGAPIYSVTQINQFVKSLITNDPRLQYVLVKGEVSNLKAQARVGHLYFSLKDENALINAVMFNTYAKKIDFPFDNGQEVVALASVDVYVPRGTYQLNVIAIEPVGSGKALMELEMLKKKLYAEGLFDSQKKRPINIFPNSIGVITAKNGAAIGDITTNIQRRYPYAQIYFFPCQVQGEGAAKDILRAFNLSQKFHLDTLIIGRGGGASEDLSAFNDETLVRAIANSKMPTIAAVGHEIDVTLTDLVADKRASTPTGAAELATVDKREIEQKLFEASNSLKKILFQQMNDLNLRINSYKALLRTIVQNQVRLLASTILAKKQVIESLNPKLVLERGYSISVNALGKTITSTKDIAEGEIMTTLVKDGKIESTINKKS